MKRLTATSLLVFALHTGAPGLIAQQPSATGPRGDVVELPPMMVEESISSVPWLYVNAGGIEFLSRCSAATTRNLVEAWLTKLQLVHAVVPGTFLARTDVSTVFVLYAQDLRQTVSAEIQRQLQQDRVGIAPSMRLSDRDTHAAIAYIDETRFDASTLSISPNHVRYLLEGRVPELPSWFVDGIARFWRRADFVVDPITLGPLVWIDATETDALAGDSDRPRTLLPAAELFASGAALAVQNRHPRRQQVRAATEELFVRWAIVSGDATRAALWRLADHAATAPVTEEIFETCFGFGFSELRDRLSDYLPRAVKETKRIDPGKPPALPRIAIERATSNQIARVRGEWERLAIGHVQRRLPQVREPYIAQARRTLRRAYDAGDRDPRLLATLGLCELEAGNPTGAVPFLEAATHAGVVRPRAYHELAALRFAALQRRAPEKRTFSFVELAPVLTPLRRAITQAPQLPECFALLAEAWSRCDVSPNASELAELETGARLFARRPAVGLPIATALAHHGRKAEAVAVLDACAPYATDDATRSDIARLREQLAPAPAPASTGR